MDCSFSKDVVLYLQWLVQTDFHNALTRVIQFVCTHRRSYKTTSFEKEQSIASIYTCIRGLKFSKHD